MIKIPEQISTLCEENPTICHYTNFESFKKIINTKTLWANDYKNLEDHQELVRAVKLLKLHLQENIDPNQINNVYEFIDSIHSDLIKSAYITSFTKKDSSLGLIEHDGILSMWRYYADDGCCIEFNSDKLIKSYIEYAKANLLGGLEYGVVMYEGVDKDRSDIEKLLNKITNLFMQLPASSGKGLRLKIATEIIDFKCLLKYQAFMDEREIRVVVIVTSYKKDKVNNEIQKNHRVEFPFELSAIERIIIGPQSNQLDKENEIKDFLKKHNLEEKIEVFKSQIPYKMVKKLDRGFLSKTLSWIF